MEQRTEGREYDNRQYWTQHGPHHADGGLFVAHQNVAPAQEVNQFTIPPNLSPVRTLVAMRLDNDFEMVLSRLASCHLDSSIAAVCSREIQRPRILSALSATGSGENSRGTKSRPTAALSPKCGSRRAKSSFSLRSPAWSGSNCRNVVREDSNVFTRLYRLQIAIHFSGSKSSRGTLGSASQRLGAMTTFSGEAFNHAAHQLKLLFATM